MKNKIFNILVFTLLGTLLYTLKLVMEPLPNIHLTSMLIIVFTIVFGVKALFPIYVFVAISGVQAVVSGTMLWWPAYTYIWLFPFLLTLLVPKKLNKKILIPIYMVICGLHGFLFGALYAPMQALIFGMNFKATVSWIITGLPFDVVHGISNFIAGSLIYPLSQVLSKVYKIYKH